MAFRRQALEYIATPKPLDDLMQTPAPLSWALIAGLWIIAGCLLAWLIFGDIATNIPGAGIMVTDTEAVIYVSALKASRLRAGMTVQLSPGAEKPWEHKHLKGRIINIAQASATPENMLETLKNPVLVNYFLREGPVTAVQIELSKKPVIRHYVLSPGALIDARMTTHRQTPLSLALSR